MSTSPTTAKDDRRIEKAHDGRGGVTQGVALFLARCPPDTPVRDLADLYVVWEADREAFERRVEGQQELDEWEDRR